MRKMAQSCAAICLLALPVYASAQDLKLPDAPGKATTEKVCGVCHGAELLIGRQETRDAWGAIVGEMVQRGAHGTDDELYTVVEYLATNLGKDSPAIKINVNKASAKDLERTLGLPEAQAAAIVHQRETKGDLKSIDELEKIPGIDAVRIEAGKKRIVF